MEAPKAPKDPIEKRSGFYIMLDKEMTGLKQPDGSAACPIFLNDGRLISFAKIVGNITDGQMLSMLSTAEGFRRLVHSIGITIQSEHSDRVLDVKFRMYGKADTYGGGTVLQMPVRADGSEHLLELDGREWSEDDDIPGQMLFTFPEFGEGVSVSVILYLRDGFQAPPCEPDVPVDMESPAYRSMIENSLISLGDTGKIKRILEKVQSEQVTMAFIGGSITQGAGAVPIHTSCYAYRTVQAFRERYASMDADRVRIVKAGIGGTPSELGLVRYEKDILRYGKEKPDIVVIEFAVNDEGDETEGECFEGLVRKALLQPEPPLVVLLFSVFSYDWNLQERMIEVGRRYHLPMVSIKNAVTPQFTKKKEKGLVVTKRQFFYDIYHPSNIGHEIMKDCLMNLFEKASVTAECEEQRRAEDTGAVYSADFDKVCFFDRKHVVPGIVIREGSFTDTDADLQSVPLDDSAEPIPQFPDNWQHINGTEAFEMKLTCSLLMMVFKDSGELDAGRAVITVDGQEEKCWNPREVGWTHCHAVVVYRGKEAAAHTVKIRMAAGDEDKKFTILGFAYSL